MAIYTSRYNNKGINFPDHYPVSISFGRPKFEIGYEIRENCALLMPPGEALGLSREEARALYRRKMDIVGVARVDETLKDLEDRARMHGNKALVLLCFEDVRQPDKWCHRRFFAEWWKEKTGRDIEELPDPSPFQTSLF